MKYRSAQGKIIDMTALAAQHERTRAVGNMKVNARGDAIDSQNKIVKPKTATVNEQYGKTVGSKSANVVKQQPQAKKVAPKEELTMAEMELEESFEDDLEVENIKAKEMNKNGKKGI